MAESIILTKMSRPLDLTSLKSTKKACILCKAVKDKEEFIRDHTCADNRRNICRACEGERSKANKMKKKDNVDPNVYFTF